MGRRGAGSVAIYITAVPQNNSLLVTAAETDQEEVATMIKALDVEPKDIEPFVMVRLTSAKADDVVKVGRIRFDVPDAGSRIALDLTLTSGWKLNLFDVGGTPTGEIDLITYAGTRYNSFAAGNITITGESGTRILRPFMSSGLVIGNFEVTCR